MLAVPLEALAMRWPSTSTSVCAVEVPRMKIPVWLPTPPVLTTFTPGTYWRISATLRACSRSMSARVNTLLAAELWLRASTLRLAVTSSSSSFRASSCDGVSARAGRLGSRARVKARRESFIGNPQGRRDVRGGQPGAGPETARLGPVPDGVALRNTSRIPPWPVSGLSTRLALAFPCVCTVAVERSAIRVDRGRLPLRGQRRDCPKAHRLPH